MGGGWDHVWGELWGCRRWEQGAIVVFAGTLLLLFPSLSLLPFLSLHPLFKDSVIHSFIKH